MDVGIHVVLCDARIHILLIHPDSSELLNRILKGRYLAGGVQCDVLRTGDRRVGLYQSELFQASFWRSLRRDSLKGDRHVEFRLGMGGHKIAATIWFYLVDLYIETG